MKPESADPDVRTERTKNGGVTMRISRDEAYARMRTEPEKWLYTLLDLADPVRRGGLAFYRTAGGMAVVSDYDEETTVRLYGADPLLLEEAASDPAVGPGTRFCFCGGLPEGKIPERAGGHHLTVREDIRTLERYGLFGCPQRRPASKVPDGIRIRAMREEDRLLFPDTESWRRLDAGLESRGEGDRILLALREDGGAAGYLWSAEAGRGWRDIVNVFVSPDMRGRGIGKALAARYAEEALGEGRRPYYGYALSPESAALARALEFEEICGETVSLYVRD